VRSSCIVHSSLGWASSRVCYNLHNRPGQAGHPGPAVSCVGKESSLKGTSGGGGEVTPMPYSPFPATYSASPPLISESFQSDGEADHPRVRNHAEST
jgi:hypothetical protein